MKELYDLKIEEAEKDMERKDRDEDVFMCPFYDKECCNCGRCERETDC